MNDMKSRASRKVAVLGPIPRDQVVTHAGERFEKYGCVMYTAVALSALLDADQDLWLPYIDILKMNLDEAGSAWLGESAEVAADPPRLSDEELRGLAHHCLDRGVGAVCVTLDERGCVAFYRDGSGGLARGSSIASRSSTSRTRPAPATRSPGDWPTATSPTGITSWPASTGMRWALSAVPARN
jgi:sugar/nucleoside kinase (ribokinase family)